MKKILIAIFALCLLPLAQANSASSDWHENQSKGAKTRLIASFYEDQNGERKLIGGIHFKISPGWKIYGQGSESIGVPPSLDFKNSTNYVKHEISWPTPEAEEEKIGNESFKYSSYHNEVVIPFVIDLKKKDQPTELAIKLDYALCKDVCVPANENFLLKIADEVDPEVLQEIQKYFPQKIIEGDAKDDTKTEAPKKMNPAIGLISALLLAFFGGAILNIMPCVLPVLSIKLLSVIKYSDTKISRIRLAFLSTIIGIISCFFVFAFLASAIKLTGNSLGWGLQFQNPYFLIFLIIILMFLISNLLGIFEVTFDQIFTTILNRKISETEKERNIFVPNFLSGILAVLLATPCSAPFLGAAISFALVQKFSVIFLVFLFIGIGFASPYIVLLASPKLVYFLPKPGSWMIKVKQLMAGFLIATILWLIYVLSNNIGCLSAFLIGVITVTILLCFRIKSDLFKYLAIGTLIIAAFSLPLDVKENQKTKKASYDAIWKDFDEAEIYQQVMKGKVVVVDITADWCLTCKFNKIRVLQTKEVMEKLKGGDIIAMRGDITKPNEEITNFLHKNNRFAIPFNAVYGPSTKTGILTSELLTKEELLESIEKAK